MSNYGYKQQVSMANMGPNMGPNMGANMGANMGPNMGASMTPSAYNYGGYGVGYSPYAQAYGGAVTAMPTGATSGAFNPPGGNLVSGPSTEESYVENILRLNRGKLATFYMTYENNREWNAKIFKGIIEAAGRDHIIISDPSTGMRYLLLMLNLDYVTFSEPINYEYPFQGNVVTQTTPISS